MRKSSLIKGTLIVLVVLIPSLTAALVPAYGEARVLTVGGTVTEAEPVNYIRSPEFLARSRQLKIVLRLWANQQIYATIEIARILGYYVGQRTRDGEPSEVVLFGMHPEKVMNRTTWDFHAQYAKTLYVSIESMPSGQLGRASLFLRIEIFLEAPNHYSNPTFIVYWEITVFDVY